MRKCIKVSPPSTTGVTGENGRSLAQSNAIMIHLAEGSRLIPDDAFDRAKMLEWEPGIDAMVGVFDRDKIVHGVRAATKGRNVDDLRIAELASSVEDELRLDGGEVTSTRIGLAVLERLRHVDEVAYVRFASVYKNFDAAADFQSELELLSKLT